MIKFDNVSFSYDGSDKKALNNISLEINEGEFVGIIGSSGAGKSTFTYAVNGIVPHHYEGDFYGAVTVDKLDTVESSPEQLAMSVGSVFQDIDAQMTATIVEDEILFGLENFGINRDEIEQRITDSLRELGIEDLRSRDLSTLSGGQKQKVAIAAIIALKPKILLLDEPTGELDPQSSRQIFALLKKLNKELGMTVVIVEQKIMLQCEFADKLIVMHRGEVIAYDTVRNVLADTGKLETAGINSPRIVTLARTLESNSLYGGVYPVNLDEAAAMVKGVIQ